MDCCTSLDDSICVAALNVALTRMLYRLRLANQSWRRYPNVLIAENPLARHALQLRREVFWTSRRARWWAFPRCSTS